MDTATHEPRPPQQRMDSGDEGTGAESSMNNYLDRTLRVRRACEVAGGETLGHVFLKPTLPLCSSTDPAPCPCSKAEVTKGTIGYGKPDPRCQNCHGTGETTEGYLHFSVVTTVAEEAAWQVLREEHAVPCQVNVNLLSPGTLSGGMVEGIGTVLRKGKSILVSEGRVYQGGRLLANVTVTFTPFVKRATAQVSV